MQLHCPVCHAQIPLEAALQHEAGRELLAMLAGMQPELARPLLHYIGYFRPARQQLGWGRALKLSREVVQLLPTPVETLIQGLATANQALDQKRAQPGWKPLGNHNYLRRCLEAAQARASAPTALPAAIDTNATAAPRSRAGQALASMEALKQ